VLVRYNAPSLEDMKANRNWGTSFVVPAVQKKHIAVDVLKTAFLQHQEPMEMFEILFKLFVPKGVFLFCSTGAPVVILYIRLHNISSI